MDRRKILMLSGPKPRLTRVMGQRLFVEPYSNSVSTNTTWAQLQALESDFDLVQLIFENHTGSDVALGGAIVAASAAVNDGFNPLDGAGGAQPWTQVTFNNGGADSPPLPTAGPATALTIPAGAPTIPNAVESRAFSDWMPVSALPRTDGGTLPLLMTRSYFAGTFSAVVASPDTKLLTDWPTISGGRIIQAFYKGGNSVATPAGFTAPTGPTKYLSVIGIRYFTRRRGLVLMSIGDSLSQGKNSTSNHNGFGLQAAKALSTPQRPVSFINVGYSSQTSAIFYQNGQKAIDDFLPTVVTIPVMSPNDTQSQANADVAWAAAQALYAHAKLKGCQPILVTQAPWTLDVTTDAYRIIQNNRVRSSGLLYADFDLALSDGATPARLIGGFNSGDSVHPNDAGYATEAGILNLIVGPIYSRG